MTQKQQIRLFQQIVQIAHKNPTSQELGEAVIELFNKNNIQQWWDDKVNPKKFTREELEVIRAVQSGWQFYRVDGVNWYWMNNVCDGNGPWANSSPNLRIVSTRMINKLVVCGQFPKNYKFA